VKRADKRIGGQVMLVQLLTRSEADLDVLCHHGTSPQRICCGMRLPSLLRTATSIGSVGQTFHDAGSGRLDVTKIQDRLTLRTERS
jgi:hypothetical protein